MSARQEPLGTPDGFVVRKRLLWTPRAKQRPHTTYMQGKPRTYTPKETVEAEAGLAAQWTGRPTEGPIGVWLMMYPDCVDVTVTEIEPRSPRLQRGDIDNYSKLILDGLNGKAWADDRQIGVLHVEKSLPSS